MEEPLAGPGALSMQRVSLFADRGPRRVLALGAHCDDIEIGCGGTLLRLAAERPDLEVLWVVFCSNSTRALEARASAEAFLLGAAGTRIVVHDFRDSFLPYSGGAVKDAFESLKNEFSPDLVFTHYRNDRHQDHRLVSELTWNTWRDHLILEYEIPKYDGDFGSPNLFAPFPRATLERKIDLVMEHFRSQSGRQWFTRDLLQAVARIRGMECGAPDQVAEGFYARKVAFAAVRAGFSRERHRKTLTPSPARDPAPAAAGSDIRYRWIDQVFSRRRWFPALLAMLLLAMASVVLPLRRPILRAAGWTLVADDAIGPADIIVVASDADGAGVLEAADLVRGSVAARVAVFADPPDLVDREFIRREIPYEDATGRSIRQLKALGVEFIEQIPRAVAGSGDEGRVLPEWCDHHRFRSVVVVSTADHSRRLRRLLRRSMKGHQTRVSVRPSRYSQFHPDRWWETREGTRTQVIELEKLILDIVLHPISSAETNGLERFVVEQMGKRFPRLPYQPAIVGPVKEASVEFAENARSYR
jgi:LmbE family N-acetylglucosaminyl deacetylase